jgi:hypothetical protein
MSLDPVSIVLKMAALGAGCLLSSTYLPPTPPIRGRMVLVTIENAKGGRNGSYDAMFDRR